MLSSYAKLTSKFPYYAEVSGSRFIANNVFTSIHKERRGGKMVLHVLYATGVVAETTPLVANEMDGLTHIHRFLKQRSGKTYTLKHNPDGGPLVYMILWNDNDD
jgi:hypothetical protein